jgi:hypothetical protein
VRGGLLGGLLGRGRRIEGCFALLCWVLMVVVVLVGCSLGGEGGQVVLKGRNRRRRMPFCVGNNDTCILLDNN